MTRRSKKCGIEIVALYLRIQAGCDPWVSTARQPKVMPPKIQEVENG